ncbi:MAG: asparaginase domain-containing protein [Alphaproteobacteria bacterium]
MNQISKTRGAKVGAQYEYSGGPVRSHYARYVEREVDLTFVQEIERRRGIFICTGPRQIGKTSLVYKVQKLLSQKGFECRLIDFREVIGQPEARNTTHRGWSELLLRAIAREFSLDVSDFNQWLESNSDMSMTNLITEFFQTYLRKKINGPIVIAFDEIDVVQLYQSFTDNFFEAIRVLAQRRDELDLSFVLIGINRPEDLLKTIQRSAFNIQSKTIALRDFDSGDTKTVAAWAEGYPAASEEDRLAIAKEILTETGGQPFLSSVLFHEASSIPLTTVDEVRKHVEERVMLAKDYRWLTQHFDSPAEIILEQPFQTFRILDAYKALLDGTESTRELRPEIRAALLASGLFRIEGDDASKLLVRSPIYKAVFDNEWIELLKRKLGTRVFADEQLSFHFVGQTKRKSICLINTGGMISMEQQPDGSVGIPNELNRFFRSFAELNVVADFVAVGLLSKDSSNMNPEDWEKIADAIFARRFDFDGFVVTHGTDTLPHTASAVAFALGPGLHFPVVFVGSQVAPHVVHGDARINLMRAVSVATRKIPEVMAVVGDQIHRGVRVQKKDDFRFEGMHSPTWKPLGIISDDIDVDPQDIRDTDPRRELELQNHFSRGVFKISLYPGLHPDFLLPLLANEKLEGVIIETLGIGNVPTEGAWSLIPFIEKARERSIPVMLASQFPIQTRMTEKYRPAGAPLAAGAIAALNMSPPAAVTKFMWVLPQVKKRIEAGVIPAHHKIDAIKKMMETEYVGELPRNVG